MRLYTVSSIDEYIMMLQHGRAGSRGTKMIPRLGKNGGHLVKTDGMISSYENCEAFVCDKIADGVVSTSQIRKWKGN